jgi:HAD superfamily hydrolase (TIGR01490 family)
MTTLPSKAAFFDLDLTITDRDTFRYYLRKHYFAEVQNWPFVPYIFCFGLLRKFRMVSLQTFKEKALITLRNKSKVHISKIGRNFFKKHAVELFRNQAIHEIALHKQRGELVFIVSAAPDVYVRWIAEYLQCDGYVCSQLLYENNLFSGVFDGKDCVGDEKLNKVNKLVESYSIDLGQSFAYSDHESDLPLLNMVGNPVAVSPTASLRKIAESKGWDVREW